MPCNARKAIAGFGRFLFVCKSTERYDKPLMWLPFLTDIKDIISSNFQLTQHDLLDISR
jgi:hypothetical protein